jgi:putative YpdA family bacillithiol system oxidoreductase
VATSLAAKFEAEPIAALRAVDVFAPLSEQALTSFRQRSRVIHLQPGDRVSTAGGRLTEDCHYFIAIGQVGVATGFSSSDGPALDLKLVAGASSHRHEFVSFLEKGDSFSDEFLKKGSGMDCVATMETVLTAIPRSSLEALMKRNPAWARLLRDRFDVLRSRFSANRKRSLPVIQDFYLRQNYSIATTMKVIDLDLCIACDGCERACADRHGVPRLVRKGPALGRLSFPISCRTCVDHRCLPACGFDALTDVDGEMVINSRKCVGCRACFEACPNGVINMIETPYTVEDFPNPMPSTDLSGRTNVPGLYLVGEAAGGALIKVAINGGVAAVESIQKEIRPREVAGVKDVAIVGAGPGGLGAALQCMEAGLDYLLFDKGHYAETIQSYPRNKLVMAEPAHIPKYGKLWLRNTTKEELIAKWGEIIQTTGITINSREGVTSVTQVDGAFEVATSKGKYRARRVVLATGNRGDPRKLGCPGETEERVKYVLTDPEPYEGKKVLVVGGGDSAVEAAMSLTDFGATATISYRKDSFGRIKAGNKTRLAEYEAKGKIAVILESAVKRLDPGVAVIDVKGELRTIENDVVFAMLGGEPPTKFFEAAGVEILEPKSPGMAALAASRGTRFYASKCDHCHGHSDQACITACPTGAILELEPAAVFLEPVSDIRFHEKAFVEGLPQPRARIAAFAALASVVVTALIGIECFLEAYAPSRSLAGRAAALIGAGGVAFTAGDGLGFWLGIIGSLMMVATALYPLHSRLNVLRPMTRTPMWLSAHIVAGLVGPAFVSFHTTLKLDRWPSLAFWSMWVVVFSGSIGRYFFTSARMRRALGDLEDKVVGGSWRRTVFAGIERCARPWRIFHVSATVFMFIVAAVHATVALMYRVGEG